MPIHDFQARCKSTGTVKYKKPFIADTILSGQLPVPRLLTLGNCGEKPSVSLKLMHGLRGLWMQTKEYVHLEGKWEGATLLPCQIEPN